MSAQSFHCVLCQDNFPTVEEFNLHEKEEVHRTEFERRMDGTSIGLLLCKCCFVSVPDLKAWDEHIKSKGHVKLVTQSEYLGKRCVWSVPGIKMDDGSIKLCKDLEQLQESGWQDPEYIKKLNMSKLETDVMIGMNCVSLQSLRDNIPVYSCSLCKVDFHHNDRNHMLGRHHSINVIWNWEKKTADRISKGFDFPKPSTKAKALAELTDVTNKIFKLEQACLNDKQYDLYLVITGKKLPSEFGKKLVNRRPLIPPVIDDRVSDEPPSSEPPTKKLCEDNPPKPNHHPLLQTPHPATIKSAPPPKPAPTIKCAPIIKSAPANIQSAFVTKQPALVSLPSVPDNLQSVSQSVTLPVPQAVRMPMYPPPMPGIYGIPGIPGMPAPTIPPLHCLPPGPIPAAPMLHTIQGMANIAMSIPPFQPAPPAMPPPLMNQQGLYQLGFNPAGVNQASVNEQGVIQQNVHLQDVPQQNVPLKNVHQQQQPVDKPTLPKTEPPILPKDAETPSVAGMPSFSSAIPAPEVELTPEILAEIELFNLMEELQLSGNFKPPALVPNPGTSSVENTSKLLEMLHVLGEEILNYQTNKREIPVELPREDVKAVTEAISGIQAILKDGPPKEVVQAK